MADLEPRSEALLRPAQPEPAREAALVAALRGGDEASFTTLVERFHAALIRLALLFVSNHEVAEEVVQETWLGVLQGIGRFEGRSSLQTWLFRILINRAKLRGRREARSMPFSRLASLELDRDEPAVDPDRFYAPDESWAGGWISQPPSWEGDPERRLLSGEGWQVIQEAIGSLPAAQRQVIALRDVGGWSAVEVCNTLGVSETNQRVLLHRARSKVRRAFERYLEGE